MTLPDERYRAIKCAEALMLDLADPRKTPKIPKYIRDRARGTLRHYPNTFDLTMLEEAAPNVLTRNSPFTSTIEEATT